METPDPPSDTPGASKKVFLTPNDIPRILRAPPFFVVTPPSVVWFSRFGPPLALQLPKALATKWLKAEANWDCGDLKKPTKCPARGRFLFFLFYVFFLGWGLQGKLDKNDGFFPGDEHGKHHIL